MEPHKDITDDAKLNRTILKKTWGIILLITILSVIGISMTFIFNRQVFWHNLYHYVFLQIFYVVTLLLTTEAMCKVFRKREDYVILLGLFFILLVLIFLNPEINGIRYGLFPIILLSALYFDRKKVYFTSILCITTTLFLTLFYKPFSKEITIENIFAGIGIYAVFTAISLGIIQRGKYLLTHLEASIKSQEELLIRNILMDKANKLDPLTDLYNHKTFHEYIERLIEQSESYPLSLQLAIIDIDNFKKVNDNYGHWVGDIILKCVGDEIKAHVTLDDFVSRYGGEEFAVILTDKSTDEAYALIEQIRLSIGGIIYQELNNQAVTVSIGMCPYRKGLGKENFFKTADECLYRAKRKGKNQTVLANIESEGINSVRIG